jgi:hypothetical protein
MIAIGSEDRWHLQLAHRWILQYNFYINDQRWGRMFVRMCPYPPFSARVCLNQRHWLAKRMLSEGIDFKQCSNAFLKCSDPGKFQELADSLTAQIHYTRPTPPGFTRSKFGFPIFSMMLFCETYSLSQSPFSTVLKVKLLLLHDLSKPPRALAPTFPT